jgi:hypothetical protein
VQEVWVEPAADKPFWPEAEDADHLFGAHNNMTAARVEPDW